MVERYLRGAELADRLGDSDSEVPTNAAWALGELGTAANVMDLIGALSDGEANVRINAAHTLGKVRAVTAVPALTALRTDTTTGIVIDDTQSQLRHHQEHGREGTRLMRVGAAARRVCDVAGDALERIGGAAALTAVSSWRASLPQP